jgi:hypothetical protein
MKENTLLWRSKVKPNPLEYLIIKLFRLKYEGLESEIKSDFTYPPDLFNKSGLN